MSPLVASPANAGEAAVPGAVETRLHGRWLIFARVGWIVAFMMVLGLFLVSLPTYVAHLQTVCTGKACPYLQLTPNNAHALQALGISVGSYAAGTLTFSLFTGLICVIVGGVLVWRRSNDWMALLVAFLLVESGAALGIGYFFTNGQAGYEEPATVLNALGGYLFFLVFSLFPSGRFVPRWAWCFLLAFLLTSVPSAFLSGWPYSLTSWSNQLGGQVFVGSILSVPITQIYRYRRVSTPPQRQQTKWILFALTTLVVVLLGSFLPESIVPSLAGSLYDVAVTTFIIPAAAVLLPLSFGIAILRYRLYDIDTIINRALVYGLLTGLLGALYLGMIIGLTSLSEAIAGSVAAQNPVVLVISTLTIATLVLPVRRRIQNFIDRRFYRKKYDAEATLAGFSATLRQQVDLDQLSEQLLAVVNETMQPAHVSLWLRQPERHPQDLAHRPDLQVSPPGPSPD